MPQSPHTNIVAIFGFRYPENNYIDTLINFLFILFAEVLDIENGIHIPTDLYTVIAIICIWIP